MRQLHGGDQPEEGTGTLAITATGAITHYPNTISIKRTDGAGEYAKGYADQWHDLGACWHHDGPFTNGVTYLYRATHTVLGVTSGYSNVEQVDYVLDLSEAGTVPSLPRPLSKSRRTWRLSRGPGRSR